MNVQMVRLEIGPQTFEIEPSEVERRREELRRAWRYEPVEHVPIAVDLSPACGETVRDTHLDTEAWFSSATRRIQWSLELVPDDYIPLAEPPWLGFHTVPAMLGSELWWADDLNAMPGIRQPLITTVDQVQGLSVGDPCRDGFCPEILRRLEIAAACFPPEVAIGGVDMNSPLGDVLELMDQTLFFLSLKQSPEAVHQAAEIVLRTQLAVQDAVAAAVGDSSRLAALGNWPTWRPEWAKALVADDIAGLVGPAVFREFDQPYTNHLIAAGGGGLLHICGPHPSARFYMHDDPPVHGLNCSYRFSRDEFATLKEELGPRAEGELGRRGHLEIMFERGVPLADQVRGFREFAEFFAPDVLALPYCQVLTDGSVPGEEVPRFYAEMRAIAEEYARRMRWST
jgi:hypothetical protein